jgi:hypothetical protein
LPQADDPVHQRYFEVGPQEDPLYVADRLGRPMVILRMGSRVPESYGESAVPGVGSPPIELYELVMPDPAQINAADPAVRAVERQDQSIPRVPLNPSPRRSRAVFPKPYQR